MARIGALAYEENKEKSGCLSIDLTGKKMKDFVFIDENGFDLDDDLEHRINLCIKFNPLAKSSKKRLL